jgi:hypothetical protein
MDERPQFTFWSLGAASYEPSETELDTVAIGERVRKIPQAVVLTAGYYASRVPALSRLLHRPD